MSNEDPSYFIIIAEQDISLASCVKQNSLVVSNSEETIKIPIGQQLVDRSVGQRHAEGIREKDSLTRRTDKDSGPSY